MGFVGLSGVLCEIDGVDCELSLIPVRKLPHVSRKPENLSIQLQVSEEVRGITIAPLIFIAFIENSFKYVSNYEDKLNEVRISLAKSNNQLFFKTFNTKENNNGRKPIDHGGIGIANVKRRLELLYPGKHALTIQNDDNSFEVILNLEV